jgi:HlyD family secretion protein
VKGTWILLAVALLSLNGCRKSADPPGTLFTSGRIDGDTVDLSTKRSGRVVEIRVREGDSVKAGQVVAVLASDQDEASYDQQKARIVSDKRKVDQLRRQLATYAEKIRQSQLELEQSESLSSAQVKEAEADLATSRAELVRSEAELHQSEIDAERYPPLAQSGAVPVQLAEQYSTKLKIAEASVGANRKKVAAAEASLLQAQAQLDNPRIKEASRRTLEREVDELKAQIAAAEADVDAGHAALRIIEANLSDLQILVPISGTILTRSAEPGRVISAGQTVLTMVDLSKLYLRGFVPEGDVGKVKVGQQAQVYLDSDPNAAIPAEVIRVDPEVMFTPENTYFKNDRVKQVMGLKLGLKGAVGLAKPGMPADARIQIGTP